MASDNEASCEGNPNFAIICAFLEKFGAQLGITNIDFSQLQSMLEDSHEVAKSLVDLHYKLLRRIKKSIPSIDKWEKTLIKVCHTFSSKDAWEIERFGYKKANLTSKVRILKTLLEMQFDCNTKFKTEINKLRATELRSQPLGRDRLGHAYWFHSDENYQIRVYKEDLDDETWTLVAKDRDGLVSLINALKDGDTKIVSSDSAGNEDSNSLSDKPLLDTGQTDSKKSTPENSDTEDENKSKDEKKTEIRLKDLSILVGPKRTLEGVCEDPSSSDEGIKKKKPNDETNDSPVVGETIEEPVLKVEGEGNGEENKDGSPIVGEAIEEEVVYFFGEGNGVDCKTGNDEKPEERSSINSQDNDSQSNCSTNEIQVPSNPHKLGVISDSKNDSHSKLSSPTTKRSRWDVDVADCSEKHTSPEKIDDSSVSSSSPKKMFFFGSGSSPFKSNMLSPSFASPKNSENSDKNDESLDEEYEEEESEKSSDEALENCDKQKVPTASDTDKSDSDIASKQGVTFNMNSDKLSDNIQNASDIHQTENSSSLDEKSVKEHKNDNSVLGNTYKIIGCDKTELTNKSNVNVDKNNDLKKIERDEISIINQQCESKNLTKKEDQSSGVSAISDKDNAKNIGGHSEELRKNEDKEDAVNEPVCIKKVAYVCGAKSDEETPVVKEVPKDENLGRVSKEEPKVRDTSKQMDPTDSNQILVTEEADGNKSEVEGGFSDLGGNNLGKTDNVTIVEKVTSKPDKVILEETSNSKGENSQKELDISKVAASTVPDEVMPNKQKPELNKESTVSVEKKTHEKNEEKREKTPETKEPQPEVVLVTGRVTRSGRVKEAPVVVSKPLTITSALRNARKKPKLPVAPPVKPKISIMESGNKKKPPKKEDLLTVDSFAAEIDGENDVEDVVEKDPFADIVDPLAGLQEDEGSENEEEESEKDESEREVKGKKKTQQVATLGSFSFDFNDSPTPTPIPVIPKARVTRKRGRDHTPAAITPSKKMKPKGKRPINKNLRKSIEQKKEQQADTSSSEEEAKAKVKKGKVGKKKKQVQKSSEEDSDSEPPPPKPKPKPKPRAKMSKNQRMLANLGISEEHFKALTEAPAVRTSRRLAQLKIKEQIDPPKKVESEKSKNKKGKIDDQNKTEKRKRLKQEKDEASEPEVIIEKKKKKKKEKAPSKLFNEHRPWQSSSDPDEEDEEEEEDEEVVEEEEPHVVEKSDHEFSPESDVGGDDDWQPLKRARTARKESDLEEIDECPCQKCGKSDHPEWILLCDKCDNGWHCSCLRPPLLNIPEGDWFCPPCQHILLLDNLQIKLREYDKKLSKKEVEDRRKERLAYVGISLENVLPTKDLEGSKKKRLRSGGVTESSSESSSESESDSDEPIYQLRQRRQARSYKFNEYDEMIKSAIGDELDVPKDNSGAGNLGRGKDIATIVKDMEPEPKPPTTGENGEVRPARRKVAKKKHRKLTTLDCQSTDEDDYSDEDFKGVSTEESDEEEAGSEDLDSEDSDDYVGKKRRKNAGPTRRSTRARTRRFDADFIDDSEDEAPQRKKKRSVWDDTESDESEGGWGPKSRKRRKDKPKKKKKKRKNVIDDSDAEQNGAEEKKKKPRPRIQYGGLTSSEEEETGGGVRTRGKRMTYVDSIGSETEEEEIKKKNPRKIESDDEDFVANDEDKESEEDRDSEDAKAKAEATKEEEKRALLVPKIYIKKPIGAASINTKKPSETKPEQSITSTKKEQEVPTNEDNKISSAEKSEPITQQSSVLPTNKRECEDKQSHVVAQGTKAVNSANDKKPLDVEKDIKNSLPPGISLSRVVPSTKEDIASQQFKMVAAKLQEIENKRKRQQEEDLRELMMKKPELQLTRMPVKRGRKPKQLHEPIVGHFSSLISNNDDENDDLSEPPGISLPLFEELNPKANESPKKRRGRGPAKPKKPIEDTQTNLSGDKATAKDLSPSLKLAFDKANIEIAAPPQPFSQSQPTPSVITRMLQTKPGQTTTYPVGSIRPKQFATMPADDDIDDLPPPVRGLSPASGPHSMGGPPPLGGQFGPGGPRRPMGGPPYRGAPGPNHYPRGMPPAHQMRGPPPGIPPHLYHHPHRQLGPSPSGGGPIPMARENTPPPPQTSGSPGPRPPPPSRFPQIGASGSVTLTPVSRSAPPTQMHNMMHSNNRPPPISYSTAGNNATSPPPPPPSNSVPPPPAGYYGNYPSPGMSGGDEAMPPSAYQGSPYTEQYSGGEVGSDNSNSKPYEEESGGGEFGGLVSYFSSQREDDLES